MATKRYQLDEEKTGLARRIGDAVYGSELGGRPGAPRTGYTGTFEQAYKNLGQGGNAPEAIVYNGTKALADAFIERIYERTGQFPSESQVREFVSGNLTTGFAEKIITGQISNDAIKTQLVDPHMGSNPDEFTVAGAGDGDVQAGIEARQQGLAERLQKIYGQQRGALKESVEESYGEQKGAIAKDLAAQGMLYNQPLSRAVLDNLERAKGKSLTQGFASLAATQASGETDIAKTIENLLTGERRAGEQAKQFGQEYALRNRSLAEQIESASQDRGLRRYGFDVAADVGRRQAQGRERDWYDYTDLALRGIETAIEAFAAGDSNESFCSLVAIKNVLKELGITAKMSEIFKVIEDNKFVEIDYGVLAPEHIKSVLEGFGTKVEMVKNAKLNGSKSPAICVVHCKDYYGIPDEKWLHAVVVTPERKVLDGYEANILGEYENGKELVENTKKFDWNAWRGDYFLVNRERSNGD